MSKRYLVVGRKVTAAVEYDASCTKCSVKVGENSEACGAASVGPVMVKLLMTSGIELHSINTLGIHEDSDDGLQIGSVHHVLQGAHAVWLVLYRADSDASCFRTVGNRHRMSDSLSALFREVQKDLAMPHKP